MNTGGYSNPAGTSREIRSGKQTGLITVSDTEGDPVINHVTQRLSIFTKREGKRGAQDRGRGEMGPERERLWDRRGEGEGGALL